jgi:hypothetical protein
MTSLAATHSGLRGRIAACMLLLLSVVLAGAAIPLTAAHSGAEGGVQSALVVITFSVVGFLVAFRQPHNPLGWMLTGIAALFVLNDDASLYTAIDYRQHGGHLPLGPVAVVLQLSWAPAIVLMGLAVLLFPDAKLPPGRWRWVLVPFGAFALVWTGGALSIAVDAISTHTIRVVPAGDLSQIDHPSGAFAWWGVVQAVWFPVLGLCLLASIGWQIVALTRADGERRQQLKWLVSGATTFGVGGFLTIGFSGTGSSWRWLGAMGGVMLVALPISLGVGILKYRLFEIDRLVSRTLSYAVVTGLLVGVYAGTVTLATRALPFSSPIGVAAATLAAAALFNPSRRRIQRVVDRRFNRARYDAEATIAAFTNELRGAVDLDRVESQLVDVVQRVVQPTQVSVWLSQRTSA